MPFIYVTTNLINGRKYLGKYSGKNSTYLGSGVGILRAIRKYGANNFHREVIHTCQSLVEVAKLEYDLSVQWDVVNNPLWYNMVYGGGGVGGFKHSESTKLKLSQIQRGQIRAPLSDEHKRKISQSKLGMKYKPHKTIGRKPRNRSPLSEKTKLLIALRKREWHANKKEKII